MSADPSKRLHPQAYDALAEGLATFQWYKAPFSQMITALFAADSSVLAGIDLQGSTKREAAREVVRRLQRDERRFQSLTVGVLMTLADYDPGSPDWRMAPTRCAPPRTRSVTSRE